MDGWVRVRVRVRVGGEGVTVGVRVVGVRVVGEIGRAHV